MEQSKYLLKFWRSEWNSVASPRQKYFVKIGTDRLKRQGIPRDLLKVMYTFNCRIYFIHILHFIPLKATACLKQEKTTMSFSKNNLL